MRKFIGTVVIVVVIVAAIGIYRGWFGVTTQKGTGETNIELKIDKEKIKQDAEAAREKAKEITSGGSSGSPPSEGP